MYEELKPKKQLDLEYHKENERSLLGCLLVSGNHSLEQFDQLGGEVKESMFIDPTCKEVFQVMFTLWLNKIEFSTLTIQSELQRNHSNLTQFQILSLAAKSSLINSVKDGLRILKENYQLREIKKMIDEVSEKLSESEADKSMLEIQETIKNFQNKKDGVKIKTMQTSLENWLAHKLENANIQGTSFGLKGFDDQNVKIKDGNLVTIAARPKTGKTNFAIHTALEISKQKPVLFFSLEMSEDEILDRLIANLANINPSITENYGEANYEKARVNCEERIGKAMVDLEKGKINILDGRFSIWQILSISKRECLKEKLGAIIIDQLSFIGTDGKFESDKNKNREYDYIVSNLKLLAKELKIPVFLLHQLNRDLEKRDNKTPQLSDIKDCGVIEEMSDLLILMHKKEIKNEKVPRIEIIFEITRRSGGISTQIIQDWDLHTAKIISK